MIQVSVDADLSRAISGLSNLQNVQIPYATSLTLNRVAQFAANSIKTGMNVFFDRPTPFTINSVGVKNSSKNNLVAYVGSFRSSDGKTPASAYLKYEILGGDRALKSTEKEAGSIFVPAKATTLDRYGNMPSSLVALIRAAVASGSSSVVSGSNRYVVIRAGNPRGLTPGIYVTKAANLSTKISGRKGDKTATTRGTGPLKPVAFFEAKANYKPRLDIEGIVRRTVATEFARQFEAQLAYAMSTAK